jgi:hypothetical protein
MRHAILMLGIVAAAAACDTPPTPDEEKLGGSAAAPLEGARARVDTQDAAASTTARASDACEDACLAGGEPTATDRATCRLICGEKLAELDDPAMARTVLARFDHCNAQCDANSPTNDATCTLSCAGSSVASVPGAGADAKTCMRPCLETLADCNRTCDDPTNRATDQATCALQCRGAAHSCLERCGLDSAS